MLNSIIIMGRLTRDPELNKTNTGVSVTRVTLAVDRDYAPQGQEKQTDFIDCVAWNKTAEFIAKYFRKGSMAVASGRLQLRDWTDNNGIKHRAVEIIADKVYFGETKRSDGSEARPYSAPGADAYADYDELDEDGELPF